MGHPLKMSRHWALVLYLCPTGAGTECLAKTALCPCSCGAGLLLCAWVQPISCCSGILPTQGAPGPSQGRAQAATFTVSTPPIPTLTLGCFLSWCPPGLGNGNSPHSF